MAATLDENFLQDVGLGGLPAEDKKSRLHQLFQTLQRRVGLRLAGELSDAQVAEFNAIADEAAAIKWLEDNFPQHRQIAEEELEKMKTELKASLDYARQLLDQSKNPS